MAGCQGYPANCKHPKFRFISHYGTKKVSVETGFKAVMRGIGYASGVCVPAVLQLRSCFIQSEAFAIYACYRSCIHPLWTALVHSPQFRSTNTPQPYTTL